MGMSQDQFVEELMINFRYTMYLKKVPAVAEKGADRRHPEPALGRLKLSPRFFDASPGVPSLAADLHIIDRAGYLSRSFAQSGQLALQRQSTAIEFAHYGLPGEARFKHVIMPVIAPCLAQLSYYPTLQALHDANRDFALRERREFDEMAARRYLIQMISYLEMLNLVVFERYKFPTDDSLATKPASQKPIEVYLKRTSPPAVTGATTAATEIKNVGGLKVTSRSNPTTVSSPRDTSRASTEQASRLEDGISQELVDALKASDEARDRVGQQESREFPPKPDDIVVDMLKRQTMENSQIFCDL